MLTLKEAQNYLEYTTWTYNTVFAPQKIVNSHTYTHNQCKWFSIF